MEKTIYKQKYKLNSKETDPFFVSWIRVHPRNMETVFCPINITELIVNEPFYGKYLGVQITLQKYKL